ncbi:FG-GAP-like repeat-containing protein [Candidatus Neomarinimicrobiota bacterium]
MKKVIGILLLAVPLLAQTYLPNSSFTIVPEAELSINMRPSRFVVTDVDFDGTLEVVFSDRVGNNGGYYFGVMSVDDIPDAGDGTETWTLEMSGKDFGDLAAAPIENKWDVAVIDSNFYTFCEIEISKSSFSGGTWSYDSLTAMAGGAAFISAQVVDLDADGTEEIVCAVYDWADDAHKSIMLLQEDGDTLIHTELAVLSSYWTGSRGAVGGANGDIDQDGYIDFVFGSRSATPDGAIFRMAYRGGTITDPANYELTVIDSLYGEAAIWSNIQIANMDADAELEVLYTASTPVGGLFAGTTDIALLDYSAGNFTRSEIPVPETDLNNGGVGNMIAGVDLDGDTNLEIYLVNDNWNDTPTEIIPRIYKLEYDGTNWAVVWQATAPIPAQNTWPALAIADLDEDGKDELLWGVVNNFVTGNESPPRILVYESLGGGSDAFGVEEVSATDPYSLAPTAFALHQNFPNPFNPVTTVSFDLNQATNVSLVVYDLVGHEVVSLVNRYMGVGNYEVLWNGHNADGSLVPTGVYIARMATPGYSRSIKMVLMK